MTSLPKLGKDDVILCVYAKAACGPGWSNTPLWVVVRNSCNGDICEVCIQPEQQTLIMRSLYSISHAVNDQLVKEADKLLRKSNCKPLPKKVEKPQPDRNQTLTPAEAQLMQTAAVEETIAFDDDWRGHINVMMQELIARLEALEAKDEENQSWQKRFGDAVDRLTARMNLIFDKVNKL